MINVLCVVGTRPEAIKMAPIVMALKGVPWAETHVLATAQHRHMLDRVLCNFDIEPDIDLDIMRPNQELPGLTARLLLDIDNVLQNQKPDVLLAQGDTTTVLVAALACFYRGIPFGHVEAGLRTHDMQNPFPEEMNRVLASRFAKWHFVPTKSARDNLLREGISEDAIHITGNTVIDALITVASQEHEIGVNIDSSRRLILVTSHRRENFGAPFAEICKAIRILADRNADIEVLYPVHPNPNIYEIAHKLLGDHPRIILTKPLDYPQFVTAMKKAYMILSDSGGVQEEAPALSKPVLVLREETERPEAVEEGVVKLVGANAENIVLESQILLNDRDAYIHMARGVSPYGDGKAAERIVQILHKSLVSGT